MSKSRLRVIAAGIAVGIIATTFVATPSHAATDCGMFDICKWSGTNFTGSKSTTKNPGAKSCTLEGLYQGIRSVDNYSSRTYVSYSNSNCTGSSYYVYKLQTVAALPFTGRSYKVL
ncbi:peptidase inhibitor family I36 protein [Micromonospora sp. NPDC005254]|uniref:peptidase inhibitor family I36 protein n=1 Tax=Micromonospora sp. NPDC005254 TaxID=3364229 RepID=UPI0036AEEB66